MLAPAAVVVVEPGCDLPAASPPVEMRAGRRAALLSVANWYPNKGVLELLDAFAALPEEMATLHLAGRVDVDPVYSDTRAAPAWRGPTWLGRVIVHGGVDIPTVAGLYAGADAFALATAARATRPCSPRRSPLVCRSSGGGSRSCSTSSVTGSRGASPIPVTCGH